MNDNTRVIKMHWILQNNIFNEQQYDRLIEILGRMEIPHSIHKVIPFVGELLPEPELDHKNVICFGSYSMRHTAKKNGWIPGVYDLESFDFNVQKEHWGSEMLNADATVMEFQHIEFTKPTFLRPISDSKVFAGGVFDPVDFADWKEKVCVLEHDYGNSLSKDTLVQVCPIKKIYAEYRFWVVDGKVVTQSEYKRNGKVACFEHVAPFVVEYVEKMIAIWKPLPAFVIDVCETDQDMKIVEINTINASGFYAGDIQKLVIALETLNGS